MADFVRVASFGEIAVGAGVAVEVGGRSIAVFRIDGEVYAIENVCKHKDGPLAEGEVDGTTVTCPWHGWEYDVTTGECLEDPACSVERFEVRVDGDDVFVKA